LILVKIVNNLTRIGQNCFQDCPWRENWIVFPDE
jgi:hypothetical protein